MTALTKEEIESITTISIFFSIFSVLGSSFIIFCYFKFTRLRKFAFTLVCILSFNDFFNQIGDFVTPSADEILEANQPGTEPSGMCLLQAWLESFFELSSVLWTTGIAATLYLSVHMGKSESYIRSKWWVYNAVCFGVPALLTFIPGVIPGAYGHAGGWCWITPEYQGWRWVQFYLPLWAAVAFNAYVYWLVVRQINRMVRAGGGGEGSRPMIKIIRRLRFFPLILVIVWLPGTINRLYEVISGDSVFSLFVLQKVFSSMQGGLNALAYGFTDGVRQEVAKMLPACCTQSPDDIEGDEGEGTETSDGPSDNPLRAADALEHGRASDRA